MTHSRITSSITNYVIQQLVSCMVISVPWGTRPGRVNGGTPVACLIWLSRFLSQFGRFSSLNTRYVCSRIQPRERKGVIWRRIDWSSIILLNQTSLHSIIKTYIFFLLIFYIQHFYLSTVRSSIQGLGRDGSFFARRWFLFFFAKEGIHATNRYFHLLCQHAKYTQPNTCMGWGSSSTKWCLTCRNEEMRSTFPRTTQTPF